MEPNLALALEDFVPVFLTLGALIWLTRMIFRIDARSGTVALVGAILITLGGLLKAASKLNWVISGVLVPWMEDSLFILMAPGFGLFAWSIWTGQIRMRQERKPRFVLQAAIGLLFLLGGTTWYLYTSGPGRTWFVVLLTLVVAFSSLLMVLLSRHAMHYKSRGTAALFIFYLLLTIVLNGMARTPSPTIGVEWTKQLLNTGASSILLLAAWQLQRAAAQSLVPALTPSQPD